MNDFSIELLVAEKIMGYTWRQWREDMKNTWQPGGNAYDSIASAEWRRELRFLMASEDISYQATEPAVMSKQTRYECRDGYVKYPSGTSIPKLMLPYWSSNMSEASKVIERMASMGYFVAIATAPGKPTKCFVQQIAAEKIGPEVAAEAADTGLEGSMAKAVCIACLKAVGEKIDEEKKDSQKTCCQKK